MKKTPYTLISLFILFGIMLAACASTPSPAGTTWKLVSYGPVDYPVSAVTNVETSVVFSQDGKVSGSVGCNSFSGDYKISGSQVTFESVAATMMACEDSLMQQESNVLNVLTGTVNFKLDGDTLTLATMDGGATLIFKK